MPTIPQLKELAKDNKVYISSRANKADIEDALRKAGIPFDASVPRAAPKSKTTPAPLAGTGRQPGDLAELTTIQEDRSATTYYVPFTSITDFNKLKIQIKLPLSDRDIVDEELNIDYIDMLTQKAKHTVEGDDGFEPAADERIVFSANVLMY